MPLEWIGLPVLLVVAGFFSGAETALFALSPEERERAGARVQRLLAKPQALLISLLLAFNMANILFFALVASLHSAESEPAAQGLLFGLYALLAALIFGDVLPKALAISFALPLARVAAPLCEALVLFLAPVRRGIEWLLAAFVRALGSAAREEPSISPETLGEVLEHSAHHGMIGVGEADLLSEVVELEGLRVGEFMTPRVDMLLLDLSKEDDDNLQILARALAHRFTWLTLVRGHADEVVGIVRLRDVLAREESRLEELAQPVLYVPEVASALDLLRLMRERKATEAIVVDEFGGTAGFMTLEHVFEEIVGDLRREGETEEQSVERLDGGRWRVAGSLSIRDWNEQFGRELVPEGFETVGGFVTALLGRIPRAGDRVRAHGLVMEVREVRARRVAKVDMSVDLSAGEGGLA